jgi:hypothetical protein
MPRDLAAEFFARVANRHTGDLISTPSESNPAHLRDVMARPCEPRRRPDQLPPWAVRIFSFQAFCERPLTHGWIDTLPAPLGKVPERVKERLLHFVGGFGSRNVFGELRAGVRFGPFAWQVI